MASPALEYFLDSDSSIALLETIEISHPSFTQTYRKVRNHTDGIEVTLETSEVAFFEYYPLAINQLGDQADLDTGIRIDFGDLGEVLPKEIISVRAAGTTDIKPTVLYRAYRSDDLSSPLIGPLRYEITNINFTREGASFEATAPYANMNKTGESYNITRFFMLRGFLT